MKSFQTVSSTARSWDLSKLAKSIFDKSIDHGDHAKFIKYSIFVDNEVQLSVKTPFKQILCRIAVNAFDEELLNPDPINDKTAVSIAEFIREMFKIDWVTNSFIHRCISSLASDHFDSMRRVKILYALIKPPIAMKIRKVPYDDSLTFYAKKIRSKVISIKDFESHTLCMEVAAILEKIATQTDNRGESPLMNFQKPPTKIDMISSALSNFNDFVDCANRIKTMNISEVEELNFLVDTIITQTMTNTEQVKNYSKLVYELKDVLKGTANSFKALLVAKCRGKFMSSFSNPVNAAQVQPVFALTHFVADLYKLDVVDEDFLKPCIDILFHNERLCPNTVFCISILFQSIGLKAEIKGKTTLSRYFTFFEVVVNNENSYRSFIYGKLLELRKNNWVVMEDKSKQTQLTINMNELGDRKVVEATVASLKQNLKTANQIKKFIEAMFNHLPTDHSKILNCAKLFKELAEMSPEPDATFSEILMRSLQFEFEKFSTKHNLNQSDKSSFASLIILAGELYREDIFSDEDLHTWLLARQVSQVSLEQLTHLSLIITNKIQSHGSKHLKTVLGILENVIHDVTIEICTEIKSNLSDLGQAIESMAQNKAQ